MQYDTKSKDFKNISEGLIETFKKAGDESVKIEKKGLKIKTKEDGSPVTNGDLRVNEIICDRIIQLTPNIPIISEETVDLKKKNTLKNKCDNLIQRMTSVNSFRLSVMRVTSTDDRFVALST